MLLTSQCTENTFPTAQHSLKLTMLTSTAITHSPGPEAYLTLHTALTHVIYTRVVP